MKKKLQLFAASALMMLGFAGAALQPVMAAEDCDPSKGLGGVSCTQTDNQPGELFGSNGIFTTIINFLLFLIGIISVLMIIYGGIQYSLSGGDSGKVTNAKNTILYAVVGLIIAMLAYAIVNFVVKSFTAQ